MMRMVGMPMPSPTARAMMSPVWSPEEVDEEEGVFWLLLLLMVVPEEPLLLLLLVVGSALEPVAVEELPSLESEEPVAAAAMPETIAVEVLLGDGLLAAGWQENMTDLAL